MSIECISFREYKKGSLLGFANIYVPKMDAELNGCSLHIKNGNTWLNLPSKEFEDKQSGETKYYPIFKIRNPDHQKALLAVAKTAVEDWIKASSAPDPLDSGSDSRPIDQQDLPF